MKEPRTVEAGEGVECWIGVKLKVRFVEQHEGGTWFVKWATRGGTLDIFPCFGPFYATEQDAKIARCLELKREADTAKQRYEEAVRAVESDK